MLFQIFSGFILVAVFTHYGETIKCIVCDSDTDVNCINPEKIEPIDCESVNPGSDFCITHTNKTAGKTSVTRQCANAKEAVKGSIEICTKINGTKFCGEACASDGCNND